MSLLSSSRLVPATNLRFRSGGEVVIGGWPTRLLRLTPGGAQTVRRWFAGAPIGPLEAHQKLAKRLVDHGLAALHHPDTKSGLQDVTLVIPVKDDVEGLVSTLINLSRSLSRSTSQSSKPFNNGIGPLPIVVVDDGSAVPIQAAELRLRIGRAAAIRLSVLRLAENQGPATARNRGLEGVGTERVVFVDADVVMTEQQLARLVGELDDPNTVAAGPRISTGVVGNVPGDRPRGTTWSARLIAQYETHWSPLDLGHESGVIGAGRRTTYLPSTCLAAKTKAIRQVGGFDPALRYGEDVDMVWRLAKLGWVRYVADVVVSHPPRHTLPKFVQQRFRYGSAAGPLAVRHPTNLAPVTLTPTTAIVWAGVASRRPLGLGLALAAATVTYKRLHTTIRAVTADERQGRHLGGLLLSEALIGSGLGLSTALCRTWLPGLLVLGGLSRGRLLTNPAGVAVLIGLTRRVRRSSLHKAVPDVAVGLLDDLAYSVGVWAGAWQARTFRPLLPRFLRSPTVR